MGLAGDRRRVRGFRGAKTNHRIKPLEADAKLSLEQYRGASTTKDEYLPRQVPLPPPGFAGAPLVIEGTAQVLTAARDGVGWRAHVSTSGPATVEFQTHAFSGWRVENSGGAKVETIVSRRGLLAARLPAAGEYELRSIFGATLLRVLSALLSLLALLTAAVVAARYRHGSSRVAESLPSRSP